MADQATTLEQDREILARFMGWTELHEASLEWLRERGKIGKPPFPSKSGATYLTIPDYSSSLDACWKVEQKLFSLCKEHSFQNEYEGRLVEAGLEVCTVEVGCADDDIDDCGPWWHRAFSCYPASVRTQALAEMIREKELA